MFCARQIDTINMCSL